MNFTRWAPTLPFQLIQKDKKTEYLSKLFRNQNKIVLSMEAISLFIKVINNEKYIFVKL